MFFNLYKMSALPDDLLNLVFEYLDFGTRESLLDDGLIAKPIKFQKPAAMPPNLLNYDLNDFGFGLLLGIDKLSTFAERIEFEEAASFLYERTIDPNEILESESSIIVLIDVFIDAEKGPPSKPKVKREVDIIIQTDNFEKFFKSCGDFNFCDYFVVDRLLLKGHNSRSEGKELSHIDIKKSFPTVRQLELADVGHMVSSIDHKESLLPLHKHFVIRKMDHEVFYEKLLPDSVSDLLIYKYDKNYERNCYFDYTIDNLELKNLKNVELQYLSAQLNIRSLGSPLERLSLIYINNRIPKYNISVCIPVVELILTYNPDANKSGSKDYPESVETPNLKWFPNLKTLKINFPERQKIIIKTFGTHNLTNLHLYNCTVERVSSANFRLSPKSDKYKVCTARKSEKIFYKFSSIAL